MLRTAWKENKLLAFISNLIRISQNYNKVFIFLFFWTDKIKTVWVCADLKPQQQKWPKKSPKSNISAVVHFTNEPRNLNKSNKTFCTQCARSNENCLTKKSLAFPKVSIIYIRWMYVCIKKLKATRSISHGPLLMVK